MHEDKVFGQAVGGDWLPSLIPACFSPPIEAGVISQLILSDKRKSTTSAHVVLFLFGMSLRGFSSLHCSFVFIYKAGECSSI